MRRKIMEKEWKPKEIESEIYKKWEKSGYFNPDNFHYPPKTPTFSIVLPPPNITDKLHVGHSSMLAIEDLIVRFHRMKGFRTLWIPGTDHAAIATQNVVEKKILKEEGKTRQDLGKKEFLKKAWSFLKETQGTILMQTRKMGASLDWSREAFTLDEKRKKAVQKMFIEMYEAGVIYRGERIVNWCPRCHSTLADDEVEYEEEKTKLYWIKYGPFVVATTRPETKLGDTAVAVYPTDKRYKKMIGKEYEIPGVLGKFKIKVVADKTVAPNFGSGAIKVTPAHSFIDNEIAQRHNLPIKKIIDEDGKMMKNCGKYAGMTVSEAREAIVEDMKKMNLIDHIEENYIHNSARCYRCHSVIEPIPSKQWFVDVDKKLKRFKGKSLKEMAIEVAKKGEIEFIPKKFEKKYFQWMENLHNWCISRQIWLGHEIPVWYKKTNSPSQPTTDNKTSNQKIYVGENPPKGKNWIQDSDTLDTWFSSGMWTFSTLGWPEKTNDLKRFHPTEILETGYDILTLWVSRMIIMSLFALQEIPFKKVYLHGLVLDKNGKKMSKSKGNGIDPVDMINKYGTDAVRLSLLIGNTPGNDMRISEEKIDGFKKFVNKLWNISKFIIQKTENGPGGKEKENYTLADFWILEKFKKLIKETTSDIEKYQFSQAGEKLRNFTWNDLADWYLEISKIELNNEKEKVLKIILSNLLKLWHPFIPFVTESIWQNFNNKSSLLMIEQWPSEKNFSEEIHPKSKKNVKDFELIQSIINTTRSVRSQYKILPNKKIDITIFSKKTKTIQENIEIIKNLQTGINKIFIENYQERREIKNASFQPLQEADLYIHLKKVIDFKKEKARMKKEIKEKENLMKIIQKKLTNKNFIKNAPKEIVQKEQEKFENINLQKNKIIDSLKNLK